LVRSRSHHWPRRFWLGSSPVYWEPWSAALVAWLLFDVWCDFWRVGGGAFEKDALSFSQIPCGI